MDKIPMMYMCGIPEALDFEEPGLTVWAAANTYTLAISNDAIVQTQNINGSPQNKHKEAGEYTEWRELELSWSNL